MPNINQLTTFLESFAPLRLAEEWDNVGLLVGDRKAVADRIMTCLTITPNSAQEAIEQNANVIVTHHPLPFRPLKKITTDTIPGELLYQLIRNGIAIYSPHTAFDSAASGINQQLAQSLSLTDVRPLVPSETGGEEIGSGRFGILPDGCSVRQVAERLKSFLKIPTVRYVGDAQTSVRKAAIACGSGGSFLAAAKRVGCHLFVSGEATFHTCLEADALGVSLLLVGHFASERFACERLAETIGSQFSDATVWACGCETDPLSTL